MKSRKQLSYWFLGVFVFLWILGPLTQLLQIVNLPLHIEWGLSEAVILEPEYGWFRADELAIAWADMTYLVTGAVFVIGAFMRKGWCIPFGFYTSAVWSFILLLVRIRWSLLESGGFDVVSADQEPAYYVYSYCFVLFGWFGMVYLWKKRNIYDKG